MSNAIKIVNVQQVTISGVTTNCPYCGSIAKAIEGTFNFDERGIMHVLRNAALTPDILIQFKKVIQEAQLKKYTPDQFKAEAEKVDPAVKSIFLDPIFLSQWNMVKDGLQTLFAFLAVVIGVIQLINQGKDTPPPAPIQITIQQPTQLVQSGSSIDSKKSKVKTPKKSQSPRKKKRRKTK